MKSRSHSSALSSASPPEGAFFQRLKEHLIITLVYIIVRLVSSSLRVVRYDDESVVKYYAKKKNVIFAFWHRHLFYLSYYHSRRFPDKKACVMVSLSRDGTRIGKIAKRIGVDYIQGSSSRGGALALRQMVRILRSGVTAAITPDGPRGPRGIVQKGVIALAKLTHKPIIPLICIPSRYIELKSWDNFVVPVPFSRVVVATGDPIVIRQDDDRDEAWYENMLKEKLDALESRFQADKEAKTK